MLPCAGQPPTAQNYPAQNVRSTKAEAAWTGRTIGTALFGHKQEGPDHTAWRFFLKGLGALTVNHPEPERGIETWRQGRGSTRGLWARRARLVPT